METNPQFNLEEALGAWRESLAGSPAFRPENVRELEAHARDSVAALEAAGLGAEEAFLVAMRRLGSGAALEREFEKANRGEVWMDRAVWMVAGVVLGRVVSAPLGLAAFAAQAAGRQLGLPGPVEGALCAVLQWGLFFGLAVWVWRRWIPSERAARMGGWLRDHPVWMAFGAALVLLTGGALSAAGAAWMARSMAPSVYGSVVPSQSAASSLIAVVFWPCLLGWTAARPPEDGRARW